MIQNFNIDLLNKNDTNPIKYLDNIIYLITLFYVIAMVRNKKCELKTVEKLRKTIKVII